MSEAPDLPAQTASPTSRATPSTSPPPASAPKPCSRPTTSSPTSRACLPTRRRSSSPTNTTTTASGWMAGRAAASAVPGNDYAVVRLAAPGVIRGFDVDTSHLHRQLPAGLPHRGLQRQSRPQRRHGLDRNPAAHPARSLRAPLSPRQFRQPVESCSPPHLPRWRHRPAARLRRAAYRCIAQRGKTLDLASGLSGGRVIAYSDAHYGAFNRLLAPGRGLNMGDGWETRAAAPPAMTGSSLHSAPAACSRRSRSTPPTTRAIIPRVSRSSPPIWPRPRRPRRRRDRRPRCSGPS